MIKLSVIIPVYNVEAFLKKCIDSVLRQTLENMEIIFIDDGSTDGSLSIIKEYNDTRIKIICKENGGLSSARNEGIKVAKGEYITFLDSDDYLAFDTAYEDMCSIGDKDKSDIVSGNAIIYFSEENNYPLDRKMNEFIYSPIEAEDYFILCMKTKRNYAPVCFNVFRRNLFLENNLMFKEGIYHEDEEIMPRILLSSKLISIYDKNYYVYRQRVGSIMNSNINIKKGYDLLSISLELEQYFEKIKSNELKFLFKKYVTCNVIGVISKYNIIEVSEEVKAFIHRNATTKEMKIRSLILNYNSNIYVKLDKIVKKIRKIE